MHVVMFSTVGRHAFLHAPPIVGHLLPRTSPRIKATRRALRPRIAMYKLLPFNHLAARVSLWNLTKQTYDIIVRHSHGYHHQPLHTLGISG